MLTRVVLVRDLICKANTHTPPIQFKDLGQGGMGQVRAQEGHRQDRGCSISDVTSGALAGESVLSGMIPRR